MANEHSGILDANALFGDLPWIAAPPASSIPPRATDPTGPPNAQVIIVTASAPRHRRSEETTLRLRPGFDPVRARLISVILCGSAALVAALISCFFYVTAPHAARIVEARPAMTSSR